jgi:hypothetical protein
MLLSEWETNRELRVSCEKDCVAGYISVFLEDSFDLMCVSIAVLVGQSLSRLLGHQLLRLLANSFVDFGHLLPNAITQRDSVIVGQLKLWLEHSQKDGDVANPFGRHRVHNLDDDVAF